MLREQTLANQLSRSVNKIVMQFMQTVRSGLTNAPRVVDVVDSHRHTFNSMEKHGTIDARKEEVRSAVEDKKIAASEASSSQQPSPTNYLSVSSSTTGGGGAAAASVRARQEADDITRKVFEHAAEDDAGEMTETSNEN